MSHSAAGMPAVENPTKGLGEVIRLVDYTWNEIHYDVSSIFPVLNGKVLDVDVPRALSGHLGINHVDGRFIIHPDRSSLWLGKSKFFHDGSEVLGMFGGGDSCEEFCLGGACGGDGLGFATIGDSAAS